MSNHRVSPGIEAIEVIGPYNHVIALDIDDLPSDDEHLRRVAKWAAAGDVVLIGTSRLDDDPREIWEVPAVQRDFSLAIDRLISAGLSPGKICAVINKPSRFCNSLGYPPNAR